MSHTIYKCSKVSTCLLETRKLQISLRYIYHYYKIMGLWKDTIPLFCITCVHQQRLHTLIYYIYRKPKNLHKTTSYMVNHPYICLFWNTKFETFKYFFLVILHVRDRITIHLATNIANFQLNATRWGQVPHLYHGIVEFA